MSDACDATHRLDRRTTRQSEASFSIVIPTREEAAYIGRTLRQLQVGRQCTKYPVEILVVDGASKDGTLAEAAGLADAIISDDPRGSRSIASARNVGAEMASGEFLLHIDADVIVPNFASLLDRVAGLFADGSVVAVTALVMPYPWEASWRDRVVHRLANAHFRTSRHYGAYFARGECQIVRASSFRLVGGYAEHLTSGEDCDLFRRLGQCGHIVYLDDVSVFHSVRRFRQLGYLRVGWHYTREWVWRELLKRSYLREWPLVR